MDASQLARLEMLCEVFNTTGDQAKRAQAQAELVAISSSPDSIPLCRDIMEHSQRPYALTFATRTLTDLVTRHWNNFTKEQGVDMRVYVLNFLASKGITLPAGVLTFPIGLLCRITKLGWFDDPQHRAVNDDIAKFVEASPGHALVGLAIGQQLIEEMNVPTDPRSMAAHRKAAVSFRDASLLGLFQLGVDTLRKVRAGAMAGATVEQRNSIVQQALSVCVKALSFDFICTNPDESAEDAGTVQVPSSWRPLLEDSSLVQLFFECYHASTPPRSQLVLEVLVLLASVRRSIFSSDRDRNSFLLQLITGVREVLRTQAGLSEQENYHQFCRMLGRLKSNYQLSEIVKVEGFAQWLELVVQFTVNSFRQWKWSSNSMQYLLMLWSRLVAAIPYVRTDPGSGAALLDRFVPEVVRSYVQARLQSTAEVLGLAETADAGGGVGVGQDDPLENKEEVDEEVRQLPTLCRHDFRATADFIIGLFDERLEQYKVGVQLTAPTGFPVPPLPLLEGQLTWLVYIIGGIVSGHQSYMSSTVLRTRVSTGAHLSSADLDDAVEELEEVVEADLTRRVLLLTQIVDYRTNSTRGAGKPDEKLELALMAFFHNFRRAYIGVQHGMPEPLPGQPEGAAAHPIGPSPKQKTYQRFFTRVGLGSHVAVTNIMVTKAATNLRYWGESEGLVDDTLALLLEMTAGYSSSRLLAELDAMKYMVGHHTADHFPFLNVPGLQRQRTVYYTILSRLVYMEDDPVTFDRFMQPFAALMTQLQALPALRADAATKMALIGLMRDLRGVAEATTTRRTYTMLFEFLYPAHMPLLARVAEECFADGDVIVPLFRFLGEFVNNRSQRIVFGVSSPNGILLFRETSRIVVAFGTQLLSRPRPADDNMVGKCMGLCLIALARAMSGGYVNFGVFELYEDPALRSALDVGLKLALSFPPQHLLAMQKPAQAFYTFVEVLFRNHMPEVSQLDHATFMQLLTAVQDGLNSLDETVSALGAAAVDHMATFLVNTQHRPTAPARALHAHLEQHAGILTTLMQTLFTLLLFGSSSSYWCYSRPVFSLMLASERSFDEVQQQLIASQPAANQRRLAACFEKLLKDQRRNLEPTSRDRFAQSMGVFRSEVRSFLAM